MKSPRSIEYRYATGPAMVVEKIRLAVFFPLFSALSYQKGNKTHGEGEKEMKQIIFAIALIFTLGSTFAIPAAAQDADAFQEERRPFDFADKFYVVNGIDPAAIVARRTGLDKFSVFDYIDDDIHRGVRIIETRTGYDADGKPVYWAFYGDVYKYSFTTDAAGERAFETANSGAVYLFPSISVKNAERQSAVIDLAGNKPGKNPLGLATAVIVEYTKKAFTKEGQEILRKIVGANGTSLDGTPIIRTSDEIKQLTRWGLIDQRVRSFPYKEHSSFLMVNVIRDPRFGAISPDAYLDYTKTADGKPLEKEQVFLENFDCLQKSGKWCDGK
jgi:hypothetical protein